MPQTPRLNDKQQAKLKTLADAQFMEFLFEHFRKLYPPDAAGTWGYRTDAELHQRIARDVARARGYQFKLNTDIFKYLVVSLELGEDFASNPRYTWARAILNEPPTMREDWDGNLVLSVDGRSKRLLASMKAQRIINQAGANQWK